MIENLADIEALMLRCRSELSKAYIYEAVLCYRAGAYRASIVSTWIAIVFDLIDKIRELAISGDANARELERQYEGYLNQIDEGNPQGIKTALEFEREILDTCKKKLQLFDQQQFIDLCRLREDRHRCAHPSFQKVGEPYHPSAEQARLHLRNAVVHVLAQPPVQGRAAIAELILLVSSEYFPRKKDEAIIQLKESALARATDALINGFVDALIFGYFDSGAPLYHKRQSISAINAIFEMYPSHVEQRLQKQLNKVIRDASDQEFTRAVAMVALITSAWSVLDASSKGKVIEFVRVGPIQEVSKGIQILSKISELTSEVQARVNKLDFDTLVVGIDNHNFGALAKPKTLEFLSQAHSWKKANTVINEALLPIFESLDKQDIERIIRFPSEAKADLINANAYEAFINRVRQAELFTEEELNTLLVSNGAEYLVPGIEKKEE